MKNIYGWLALILAAALLLMPLMAVKPKKSVNAMALIEIPQSSSEIQTFKVKNSQSGEITEINARDYIFGVVAAEMPASYHTEALKAQAVAAYTFALYKKEQNKQLEYDITDSHLTDQSYITRAAALEKWGDSAAEYEQKINQAVDAVSNIVVAYNGKLILSVYTAISGGKTESSENVWGNAVPYLTPAESIGDLLCPDYLSSASFTTEEINAKLCVPNGIKSEHTLWFSSPKYSDSGTVISMDFSGVSLSGAQIRDALGIRSANFDVTYSDGKFNFSVRGYGHLCGMSQYGANYMAMQGSTYNEILEWYYKDCKICQVTE